MQRLPANSSSILIPTTNPFGLSKGRYRLISRSRFCLRTGARVVRWLGLVFAGAQLALAAEQDPIARLDEALKAVAQFEYGKDPTPLTQVEQIVVDAAKTSELRGRVEERLDRMLSEPATRDAKEFVCRQLFTLGTTRSIPQLAALLTDPGLSHMARYALERNEDPAASAALRSALSRTSGNLQAGILNSLGNRRFEPAVPDIAKLLTSSEPSVAQAAAVALGKISDPQAINALETARVKAPSSIRSHIDEALLIGADRLVESGQNTAAARIYRDFYAPTHPLHLRIAGLRGLVAARDPQSTSLLAESIKGSDPILRAAGMGLARTGAKGQGLTQALAALLPALPPGDQELLLGALADRGDPAAASAALAAVKSDNEGVRLAAYQALGPLGDAATVDLLILAAAGSNAKESTAARTSLLQLTHGDINSTLVRALDGGDPKRQIEALRAIAGRHVKSAVPSLFKLANQNDHALRQEAIRALGEVIDESSFAPMVGLAAVLSDAGDLAAFEQAAGTAFLRVAKPDEETSHLVQAVPQATLEAKPVLLRLLGQAATPRALETVRAALKDGRDSVREAAVRVLADWPDASPASDLLSQMQSNSSQATKVIALRGYVRMASLSKEPAAMYARAMELAQRPEDKKLVLSGLGAAAAPEALALVEPCLKDEQLCTEAALAAVQIADRLRQTNAPRAKSIVQEALSATRDSGVRKQAQEVLSQIEQYEDYILDWVGAGPYQAKDKDGHGLFDMPFPPELPEAKVNWARLTKGVGSWDINLAEALGGADNVAGYARTRVWSPEAQEVQLELGSDDGVKVWLNGTVVHANNTERGLAPRQDLAKVRLKQGWNELLLKITNQGDGWAFCCRVRRPDGAAAEGLKFEAK
jgi:HEAT repeat protein